MPCPPPDTLSKRVVTGDSVLLNGSVSTLQWELTKDQLLATLSGRHQELMRAKANHLDSLLSTNNTEELKRNVDVFRREMQQYTADLQKYDQEREAFARTVEADEQEWSRFAARMQNSRHLFEAIEQALLNDGIIEKGQKYGFVINARAMVVNGITQAPDVWERCKVLARQFGANVDQPGYGNISKTTD